MPKRVFSLMDFVPVIIVSILFISQIIVGVCLLSVVSQITILAYAGAGLYIAHGYEAQRSDQQVHPLTYFLR